MATITTSTAANPSVITTSTAHGWVTGNVVAISGHTGSTPTIDGNRVITVLSTTTFSIPVNVTVAGTGGTVTRLLSSSVASPSIITTPEAHGLVTGDYVIFAGHTGSTPALNGMQQPITVLSTTTFSIVVNVTVGGTGGTVTKVVGLSVPIWSRQGTAAQLATIIPGPGEWCYTTDTKKVKYGDGSTVGGVSVILESSTGEVGKAAVPVTASSANPGGLRLTGLAIGYSDSDISAMPGVGQGSFYFVAQSGLGNARAIIRSRASDNSAGLLVECTQAVAFRGVSHTGLNLLELLKGTGFVNATLESGSVLKFAITNEGTPLLNRTITAAATTGAQTIDKPAGTVNFAAAATSLVVTNSLVTASSIILPVIRTNDATMKSVLCVAGAGSFTIHANAAATAETSVGFLVTN